MHKTFLMKPAYIVIFKLQTICYKENEDFAIFHHSMTRYVYEIIKPINS